MSKEKKKRVKLLTLKQVRQQKKPLLTTFDLKSVREWVGISQAQLSQMSGISKAAIANVEAGRYKMAALNGAELFAALALAISPELTQGREQTKREALRLLAFQQEINRKSRIAYEAQIEALKRKCEELDAEDAYIKSKEAKLHGL